MADGNKVGSGYIEITPEISKTAMNKFKRDVKSHLEQMGKEVDKSLKASQQDLVGGFKKQMTAFQKGQAKGVFDEHRKEMESWQRLQKQRDASLKANDARQQKSFEAEKRRIAESMKAQKSFAEQRQNALNIMGKAENEAYVMERKRIEGIQKAEVQAHLEKDKRWKAEVKDQERRLNDLSGWYQKKKAIEDKDMAESLKAAKQSQEDMDKIFKYRTMRAIGASPEAAASAATGKAVRPGELSGSSAASASAAYQKLATTAKVAGIDVAKAMDSASHTMSQFSTRIGLASFQLQLLGGFATMFLTGPVAFGLGRLASDGLKFAVSIDYARASMKALLGPSEDVEKIISDIRRMAIESPLFNTEDAISYAQKLAAVGVKGKDLYKSMQALSNIFLTGGVAGPERANLAMMAYTQILSKGSIGMDDLRQQLAEHLPNAFQVFGEAAKILGYKDIEALNKAMKEGKVTSDELNAAFIKLGNSPKYLQGATNAAQTLGGVWQAFKEEVQSNIGLAFDKNRKGIIDAINGIRPVVLSLVNGMVAALPTLINWLGRLVVKAQEIKEKWDALSPKQQEAIQQMILIGLAAGPAAIAIGIFGTAVSGAANSISLLLKVGGLLGGAAGAIGGWAIAAAMAIAGVITVIGVLYNKSEAMRTAVLQVLNVIKDFIASVLLPVLDRLIGSVQSVLNSFEDMGVKSEDLAYILGFVLMIPIVALIQIMGALIVVIKAVQFAILVILSVVQALLQTIAYLITGFRELFELLAKIPGAPDAFKEIAASADRSSKKLMGLMDVSGGWKRLMETNSNATDGWQSKLKNTDLTVTGLGGAMGGWNGIVDQSIAKQITLEEAINNARTAMQGQASTARSLTDASDAYNTSLLGLKESIKANGKTLNEHSRAGQSNRAALKSAAAASYEMMLQDIRSGVPMEQAIKRHKDRTKALKDEFGKNKETRGEANKLIESYGKVPKDVKTLLKMMGYTDVAAKMQEILAAQKVAANPGMKYSTALANERKAWQIEKRSGLKGDGFKTGGLIRGPGGPTGDKIPIMASDLEYMIQSKAAQKLGKPVLDYINRTGELPTQQFAKGGQVTWPINLQMSGTKFPELLGGGPNGGGMGWQKMMAVLRQRFPGLPLISGYRPGARTSTGNASYHGAGRAVDVPPRWDVFNWISQNYGRGTKELIYTPAGGRQIKNGQNHTFTGGTIQQDHYDHVHWAYDNGGQIAPGQPFINKTGVNELALNPAQGKALEQKITDSDRPLIVSVYVDGVKRDAEIVFEEKAEELIRALGGV